MERMSVKVDKFLLLGMPLGDEEAFKDYFSNLQMKGIGFSMEHARCSRRMSY
jgi:hypothetical protein